jgi:hypothetical protein
MKEFVRESPFRFVVLGEKEFLNFKKNTENSLRPTGVCEREREKVFYLCFSWGETTF